MRFLLLSLLFVLGACSGLSEDETKASLTLKPVDFENLPSWSIQDAHLSYGMAAFAKSCARILKNSPEKQFGALKEAGTYANWQPVCQEFLNIAHVKPPNTAKLKTFFEENFTPYEVRAGDESYGLFTGYYEASLKGSYTHTAEYSTPLYKRPDDLVMVQLGEFRDDLKGRRIAGRVTDGKLTPYETRGQIVNGNWPHDEEVLLWVNDPVDAFFLQIQGSGRVDMVDGSVMRIGYAGQNGHIYYAIGRELIKRGALTKENVSMQSIRAWLENNPDYADEIMNTNASYVFFRELDTDGPVGGEGLPLTPLGSLAIDRSLISYGLPVWVDIEAPLEKNARLNHLMVTQDTGGAIRGPVRGDVFWGAGKRAEKLAGAMKSKGRYWIFLPKNISNKSL